MPDLFLLASKPDAELLETHLETIGAGLRFATSSAISDLGGDPKKVALYLLPFAASDNASPLQIIGLASWTDERERHLETWRNSLGAGWSILLSDRKLAAIKKRFPMDKVEIWPLLVKGSFGLASFAAKMYLEEKKWR